MILLMKVSDTKLQQTIQCGLQMVGQDEEVFRWASKKDQFVVSTNFSNLSLDKTATSHCTISACSHKLASLQSLSYFGNKFFPRTTVPTPCVVLYNAAAPFTLFFWVQKNDIFLTSKNLAFWFWWDTFLSGIPHQVYHTIQYQYPQAPAHCTYSKERKCANTLSPLF